LKKGLLSLLSKLDLFPTKWKPNLKGGNRYAFGGKGHQNLSAAENPKKKYSPERGTSSQHKLIPTIRRGTTCRSGGDLQAEIAAALLFRNRLSI